MINKDLYAVFGKPVFHSLSPKIHNSLFQAFKVDGIFLRIAAECAEEIFTTAEFLGIKGFNVTAPYKSEVMRLLDKLDKNAQNIGAVNTVLMEKGKRVGYNTDYTGVINSLNQRGISLRNKNCVILGAGGAARAAAYGALISHAKKVTIINRSTSRGEKASQQLGCDFAPLKEAEKVLKNAEILISCIPSAEEIVDRKFIKKNMVILEASYKNPALEKEAAKKGCRTVTGLEWLMHQAFPAFRLFSGQEVPAEQQKKTYDKLREDRPFSKTNIALIGFMGAGKTTIGQRLAKAKKMEFVDIDKFIESFSQKKITDIFRQKGEKVFRAAERAAILDQIPGSLNKVFSLGGGSVIDKENRRIISEHCHVIWLLVSSASALKRTPIESRPILDRKGPEYSAEKILKKRIPFYAGVSDIVFNSENGSPKEITERIYYEMGQAI